MLQGQFDPSLFGDHRIDVSQDYEVLYWSQKLGVSPQRLREIVVSAGPMLKDVRRAIWHLEPQHIRASAG